MTIYLMFLHNFHCYIIAHVYIHFSAVNLAVPLQQLLKSVGIITIKRCISMTATCGTTFISCKLSLMSKNTDLTLLPYGMLLLMAVPGISVCQFHFQ